MDFALLTDVRCNFRKPPSKKPGQSTKFELTHYSLISGAQNESSVVRRQERDTPTHLIKIPNLHMTDVLLKIDWMMADAVRTRYHRQFSIG